jgi:[NiFe] hydrogenase diaphorase moiety large subunit
MGDLETPTGNGLASANGPSSASGKANAEIVAICAELANDKHRTLDILLAVQDRFRWISPEAMHTVAAQTGQSRIQVEGVASFYHFLSLEPKGAITIRLCDDIVDRYAGLADAEAAFEQELGIAVGETSSDGRFSLDYTPCIGMCDQAPAAMINDVIVTRLTGKKARSIAAALKNGAKPEDLVSPHFDALSPYERASRTVDNNIRHAGEALLGPVPTDKGLEKAVVLRPEFVICNADEGEPGTFKDRVLLTERPHLLVEGMTIAARAVGAKEGSFICAASMSTCANFWNKCWERRRARLLGKEILGKALRLRYPYPDGRGRLYLRRRRRADQLLRRPARRAENPPALPGQSRLSRLSDRGQQCGDLLPCSAHSGPGCASGSMTWALKAVMAPSCSRLR